MVRKCLLLCSFAAGCSAMWKPANGVIDLDAVEEALHKVEHAPLTPQQRKLASHVVADVEQAVVQLSSASKLTKVQKMQKAKAAIDELQGLQSQWELAAVEADLQNITTLPHLSPEQRASAKKVVADVEATVERVQSGKLTGAARNEQVSLSIKELQDLQRDWLNTSVVSRVDALQREIAAKKVLLKKEEMELKLASLQKELAEKQLLLKKLNAEKDQSNSEKKQSKEDAAEAAMVAKLVATAKTLAAKPKVEAQKNSVLSNIIANLQSHEQNVSASIARMDAEEKVREAQLSRSLGGAAAAPKEGKTDAIEKGQKMLAQLLKQEHRKYLKARAFKEAQREELDEGVRSVRAGDVAGLSKLMQKMQTETKSLQAKSKSFLY